MVVFQIVLLFVTTVLVNMGLLYTIRIFKLIYFETATGERFARLFPESTRVIIDIAQRDATHFAMDISLIVLSVCLIVSVVCQLLHIARFFYQPRGAVGKLVFWGLPLTGIAAFYLHRELSLGSLLAATILALAPTLIIFTNTFRYAFDLLPEFGDIINIFTGRQNDD